MSKVDKLLHEYSLAAGLLSEIEAPGQPAAAGQQTAAPLTTDDMSTGGALPPDNGQDPNVNKTFEGEEGHQNYIDAVKDMRELLIIDLDDARQVDDDISSRRVDTLEQAFEVHEKLRDIIDQIETKDLGV
tara:strand:- start:222 stop:611 length:390 start_codon:yes stop_codon:yes gene_type:complete